MLNLKVNISNSFIHRARCSKCSSKPIYYFFYKNPVLWYDPNRNRNSFEFIKKYCKRLSSDDYKFIKDIRYAGKITQFNHSITYKGFNPKLHRIRGINPVSDYVEHLTCECGRTVWSFTERSVNNRPEIFNKRAKYKHSVHVNYLI